MGVMRCWRRNKGSGVVNSTAQYSLIHHGVAMVKGNG